MRSSLAGAHLSALHNLEGAVSKLQGLSQSLTWARADMMAGDSDSMELEEAAEEGRASAVAQVTGGGCR